MPQSLKEGRHYHVHSDWTERQTQVLDLLVKGRTNPEIAEALGVSLDGAEYHVSEVITKLGVDSREEAADYWREYNGWRRKLWRAPGGLTIGTPLRWAAVAAGGLAFAGGVAAIAIVALGGDDEQGAASPGATPTPTATEPVSTPTQRVIPTPPGPDVTPEPGATPDTTQPWWYVPWVNAERDKPLFDGTLAGIRIANGAQGPAYVCDGQGAWSEDISDAAGSPVDVSLPRVPVAVVTSTQLTEVGLCGGTPWAAAVSYSLDVHAEWAPWGGSVFIYRHFGEPVASVAIPAWRWEEREIGGLTVAVAHPIIDELGLRLSAIVAYRDGVVTVIQADGVPFAKLLEIGEGVLR